MRVLIVEDEIPLAQHISAALLEDGHDPAMVHDGAEGLAMAERSPYDLILLDVMLPNLDGFEFVRRLRAKGIPSRVLMLTARGEWQDRVEGLQLGADDYLSKPFAMQELRARVLALGRRYAEAPTLALQVGDLRLNLESHEVHRGDQRIELSVRELALLKVLMREPGRVFTRTELCERVWEREHEYDTKLVEVFVGRLRKKLGEPSMVHTVRHVGYTLRAPLA